MTLEARSNILLLRTSESFQESTFISFGFQQYSSMLISIVFRIDCYQVHYVTYLILGISQYWGIATSIVVFSDHRGM